MLVGREKLGTVSPVTGLYINEFQSLAELASLPFIPMTIAGQTSAAVMLNTIKSPNRDLSASSVVEESIARSS